jgi:hypothetical protein
MSVASPYVTQARTILSLEGRSVVLARGTSSVTFRAIKGERRAQFDAPGGRIETVLHEWLCEAAALTLAGEPITPQRGDKLEHDGERFDVVPETFGPAWEWHDPDKSLLLIRTRKGL